MKYFARNKKALHDYIVLERFEAGIVLIGSEAKSIRSGRVVLNGAYAVISRSGTVELINCTVPRYSHAHLSSQGIKEDRSRVLLLHKKQIKKLIGKISSEKLTLIPLSIYENEKRLIKIELGLCKHKKAHQAKEILKEKDIAKEVRRELKGKFNY